MADERTRMRTCGAQGAHDGGWHTACTSESPPFARERFAAFFPQIPEGPPMETMQTSRPGNGTAMPTAASGRNLQENATTRGNRRSLASASHTQRQPDRVDQLARGLGWFSIALGAAELLAPRALDRAIGAGSYPNLTRAFGLREIAAGVGLLTQPNPEPWLWARVAGDALDLGALGAAMLDADDDERVRLGTAIAAVAGVTALDIYAAYASREQPRSAPGALRRDGTVRVEEAVTVNADAQTCYGMWRDLANLPRFMKHLKSVQPLDDRRSHWVAKGPGDTSVEWDAEITRDEPGSLLSWRSTDDADVENAGAVRFLAAPAGRGTIISVNMQYAPPGGKMGMLFAKLTGEEPKQQVRDDLRRFKQLIETGEIPTTEGQPHGSRPAWYQAFGGSKR
jgi:uncharacterized membrane protein